MLPNIFLSNLNHQAKANLINFIIDNATFFNSTFLILTFLKLNLTLLTIQANLTQSNKVSFLFNHSFVYQSFYYILNQPKPSTFDNNLT